jgi:HSP20 family protein
MMRRNSLSDLFGVWYGLDNLFDRTFPNVIPEGGMSLKFLPSTTEQGGTTAPRRDLARFGGISRGIPAVESFEKGGNIHLRAELPGVDPSNLDISITGDLLVISGERENTGEVEEASFQFREMSHGKFERQFTLPEGVDTDKVRAEYKNGMLELIVPLPVESKPRQVKIAIKSGEKKGLLK